jgi:hypothetical protein
MSIESKTFRIELVLLIQFHLKLVIGFTPLKKIDEAGQHLERASVLFIWGQKQKF